MCNAPYASTGPQLILADRQKSTKPSSSVTPPPNPTGKYSTKFLLEFFLSPFMLGRLSPGSGPVKTPWGVFFKPQKEQNKPRFF